MFAIMNHRVIAGGKKFAVSKYSAASFLEESKCLALRAQRTFSDGVAIAFTHTPQGKAVAKPLRILLQN
jgi:hypothetical protein